MHLTRYRVGITAVAFALASCAAPIAGVNPTGGVTAPTGTTSTPPALPAATATPVGSSAVPSQAPAGPTDARVRLTGTVLLNETPVADASVVAQDLATGKALPLAPWTDAPAAHRLLQTVRTDAQGRFDGALPTLAAGQLVKVVVTKGSQTFTTLFNERGQAVGGDEVTTPRYTLQQGQSTAIQIRLRLTAASTAASQAFEGALRLTFQLPAAISAERRSATLEAARKAADTLAQALATKPEVAGRIVSSLNNAGEVTQVEAFRTAVTNLSVFTDLFRAVQSELQAVSLEKLSAPEGLDPIRARHFPLDDVIISPSGFLGFSGQQQPITLAGQVQSNFIPRSGRGGGSSNANSGTGPEMRIIALTTGLTFDSYLNGLARVSFGSGDNRLAFVNGSTAIQMFDAVSGAPPTATPSIDFGDPIKCIAQAPDSYATRTLYVGTDGPYVGTYHPNTDATASLTPSTGTGYNSVTAGAQRVYAAQWNNYAIQFFDHDAPSGPSTVQVNNQPWELSNSNFGGAMAIHQAASPTIFVGTNGGNIFAAEDGGTATRTVATGIADIRGMVFATPTLYVSSMSTSRVIAVDVNSLATSVFLDASDLTASGLSGPFVPHGLTLDDETNPTYLYVLDENQVPPLGTYRLLAPAPPSTNGRILRVRITP